MAVTGALLAVLMAFQQDSLSEARKAAADNPGDYTAHFNLAFELTQRRQDPEAAAEYRRTLELKPDLYEAQLNLGILLLRDKKPDEALAPLRQACDSKPAEARPNLYYGQALLDTGDTAQAEQHFRAAIGADPGSAPAKAGLGRALLGESKLEEAVAQFRAANDRNGLLEAGTLYEKAGKASEAIAIYQEFPENPEVREHLGQLQVDNKDAAAAIPNLEDAVRRSPTAANRLALADAYRLNKQTPKMLEQLQLASSTDPGNYGIRMALGRALRDEHRLVPAAQQFQAAATIRPDAVQAWNELASALIVSENYAEGLAALDHIRALGKELPGDFFLRAITLDKLKMRPQAVAAYQRFLDADGGAHPDQEFQARQRMRIIESELRK